MSVMKANRGFTLIEVAITLAVIAIVASAGYFTIRTGARNAGVSGAAYEATLRLQGLRVRALGDGADLYAILLDARGNDATDCGVLARTRCTTLFVLRDVDLATFSIADLASGTVAHATLVDRYDFARGIRFARSQDGKTAAPPFGAVEVFDTDLTKTASSRAYVAFRFTRGGEVMPFFFGGTVPAGKAGSAFALGNELSDEVRGEKKGVLVGFPTGIVRSLAL
jgi:prepilin-type N-terminal cleavage/methylation domain-containing protein